jgi:hypothetical protein
MSRYDGYDCSDLGCGPEFCDYPYCKAPHGEYKVSAAKMEVKIIAVDNASPTLRQLAEEGTVFAGPLCNGYIDEVGNISIMGHREVRDPGCPACQVPRTEPHLNDCAILRQVLDHARDHHIPMVHGVPMTVAGHPFYGSSRVPPPEPPSLAGPDRGE